MIDWDRVRDVAGEVGPQAFEEVTALFLRECEDMLAQMAAGGAPPKREELHFLAGAGLSLGFAAFAQQCGAAEARILGGEPAGVDAAGLARCFTASRTAFETGCCAQMTKFAMVSSSVMSRQS